VKIIKGKGGLFSAEGTPNLNSWGFFIGYGTLESLRRAVIRKIRADYRASNGGALGFYAEYAVYHRDIPGGVNHLVGVYRAESVGSVRAGSSEGERLAIAFAYAGPHGRIYHVKGA
jgi:hypothetical protein